jgi:uncharacterized protein (DUF2384 family)
MTAAAPVGVARELAQALTILDEFFSGDKEKAETWLNTENTLLGGIKPIDMILQGRGWKLIKWMRASVEANWL